MKNPFDYANPVVDRELFAGRSRELAEVEYYLDLARAQKGVGLAFVGARTSGKTSLLNMAQDAAERRGFLCVRLDLTSGDVTSEIAFLSALYEALFLAGRKGRVWRDQTDEVYASFRDAMAGASPEAFRKYCGLAFPQVAVAANRSGGVTTSFPVALLQSDLSGFRASVLVNEPHDIAILVDEGDHLAKLQIALEKLRHVMSHTTGLVVIIAGTDHMLGTMDAVFAPIVRQFKRITLTPFISPSETRECLLQRLRRMGQESALTQGIYRDFHSLAQGHPYEAQLIAHYVYRRYEERPEDGFGITVSVLNEVLAQVERFRDSDHDKFASALRRYDVEVLRHLATIVLYPRLSLHDKACIDALAHPGRVKERIRERGAELKQWAERFVNDKVLVHNRTTKGYDLNGDQFDTLYAKLLAQTKGISWRTDDRTLVELVEDEAADAIAVAVEARLYTPLVAEPSSIEARASREDDGDLTFVETRYWEVMSRIWRYIRSWRFRDDARQCGVDPVSWTSDLWGRRVRRCRRSCHHHSRIRRSSVAA